MESEAIKLVVYVPESHADQVREALARVGAGKFPEYSHCTFSAKGIGRFIPLVGANPTIGEIGKLEEVVEERIETVCYQRDLEKVIEAVKLAHPYEQVALDVFPLLIDPVKIMYKEKRKKDE